MLTRNVLKTREGVAEEDLLAIEADVNAQIQEMLRFSVESPVPEVCDALTHVMKGSPWRCQDEPSTDLYESD